MQSNFLPGSFLGSNSFSGFRSLYNELYGVGMLYIIKGSPGCGKSGFMKRIADTLEDAGTEVERVYCSGDPDSLDAVIIPSLNTAYADGTSPHVLEPRYPGVDSTYINLGEFLDLSMLARRKGEITDLFTAYRSRYKTAYSLLSSAGSLPAPAANSEAENSALRRARGIIKREIKKRPGTGVKNLRFISAFCCSGCFSLCEGISGFCSRIYVLENRYGLAGSVLGEIASAANGYDVIVCRSPLEPEKTSHLIIPELSLAFVTEDRLFPYSGEHFRRLRLDALARSCMSTDEKRSVRETEKQRSALLASAAYELRQAKSLHDRLEKLYNPCVDFASVYTLAAIHARKCLSMKAAVANGKIM